MSPFVALDVVEPTIATTPLPRSKDPFAALVAPPPPKYVAYNNWLTPTRLGFSFIANVSLVPWKVVWKPLARLAPPGPKLNAVAEGVFPPAKIFPEESSKAPHPAPSPDVLPPPTFKYVR